MSITRCAICKMMIGERAKDRADHLAAIHPEILMGMKMPNGSTVFAIEGGDAETKEDAIDVPAADNGSSSV